MRVLLLAQLHRFYRMRFVCLHPQDRHGGAREDDLAFGVDDEPDLVGEVGIVRLKLDHPLARVLQHQKGAMLQINQLAPVNVRLNARFRPGVCS